jgi:hypothetical protein
MLLGNAIEQDRLLAPAVGSEILLWESTGMRQRCCTQFLFVTFKKNKTQQEELFTDIYWSNLFKTQSRTSIA